MGTATKTTNDKPVTDLSDTEVVEEATALATRRRGGDLLAVIKQALTSKADVEIMRELLAMRREERADQAREAYAQAMVNFRAKCHSITRTGLANVKSERTGKTHSWTYAQLPQAVEQIQPLMTECGLAATWTTPQQSPQWIEVSCTVTHILGHCESTTMGGPPDTSGSKNQLQAIKSTWTYLRRVTLFSLLGLVDKDEVDDDGGGGAPGTESSKPQGQREIEQGNGALSVKQRFVQLCQTKADDANMSLAVAKQIFEAVAARTGSDDVQTCLDFLAREDVSVDREGRLSVAGSDQDDEPPGFDDAAPPDRYICIRCKQKFPVKPANGKCPGREGKKCLGEVREIILGNS